MKNFTFSLDEVPQRWAVCFNKNCPLAERCQRRQAAELMTEMAPQPVLKATCVTPLAYRDGHCIMFTEPRSEKRAWGFGSLYDGIPRKAYPRMKAAVMEYLCGQSTYYRYNSGEKTLSERQQQWIAQLFSRNGFTAPVVFDHYKRVTLFPNG